MFLAGGLMVLAFGTAGMVWYELTMADDQQLTDRAVPDAAFFASPKQAVEAIREMQGQEDWASLARYYNLEGSGIDRETLVSGEFFIRTERPEVSHPGGFWRYKHPFAPSFEYAFTTSSTEAGVVIVRVDISIDEGSESPMQRGWQEFLMRESKNGFQVLPGSAQDVDREVPTAPGPPPPGLPKG